MLVTRVNRLLVKKMDLIPIKISLFLALLSIETLKESDLTIGKMLGRGSFGEVFECYLSSNDAMKFAIKFIKSEDFSEAEIVAVTERESCLNDCLPNTNVVQHYG